MHRGHCLVLPVPVPFGPSDPPSPVSCPPVRTAGRPRLPPGDVEFKGGSEWSMSTVTSPAAPLPPLLRPSVRDLRAVVCAVSIGSPVYTSLAKRTAACALRIVRWSPTRKERAPIRT
jgi:hypothetical protein